MTTLKNNLLFIWLFMHNVIVRMSFQTWLHHIHSYLVMQRMEDRSEEFQFSRNHMDCQENARKIKHEPNSDTCNGGQPDINQFTEAIKCEQNRFDTLCYLEETGDYNVCNDLPVYNRKFGVVPVKIETTDDCVKNEPCVSDTCESYMSDSSDFHLPNECSVYVKGHIDNKTVDVESNRRMSNTKNTSWEIKRSSDTPLAVNDRIKRSSDTQMTVIDSSNYHINETALDLNNSVGSYGSRNTPQDRETGMVRVKIEPGTCNESQYLISELYSKPYNCGTHSEEGQIPVEQRGYTTEHDSFIFESCSNRPIFDENLESNKGREHESHMKYEYNVFDSGHPIKEEVSDRSTEYLDQSSDFHDHINGVGEAGSSSHQHAWGTEIEQVVDQHIKEEGSDRITKCLDQSGEFHDHDNGIGEANSSASEKHGRGTENEQVVDEPTETFNCVLCVFTTRELVNLHQHYQTVHRGKEPFTCEICYFSTTHHGRMKTHMMLYTGVKPFKFDECEYSAMFSHHIKLHKMKHTGVKRYKCDVCDYSTERRHNLTRHKLRHTEVRPYKCDACDYSTVRRDDLARHALKHTGEKSYNCDVCDYSTARSQNLTRHKLRHTEDKPYKCDKCDYSTVRRDDLIRHTIKHTGAKRFKCNACDYSAARRQYLTKHKLRHTEVKPYKCDKCDYSTVRPDHLQQHIKRKHTGAKRFKCDVCGYTTMERVYLERHIAVKHKELIPYNCDMCA